MLMGHIPVQAISAAAELGIADLLSDGPRSPADLAAASGAHPEALYRVLRYLASLGIFEEDAQGRFALNDKAHFLKSGVDGSLRDVARMFNRTFPSWTQIVHSVRTSGSGFTKAFGKPLFDYLGENPEDAAIFDAAMTGIHGPETNATLDAYDFSGIGTLVDIGGGNGSVLTAALQRNPGMKGILFDLPHVAERTRDTLQSDDLNGRLEITGGSFFESLPTGADAYMMRHIIHDWYDDDCIRILKNCRKAMAPNGRVLVVEAVVPKGNEPSASKLFDVVMLVIPGGLERTEGQYQRLFEASGFELTSITPTASVVSVVEGRPR